MTMVHHRTSWLSTVVLLGCLLTPQARAQTGAAGQGEAADPEEAQYQPAIEAANRGQSEVALGIFTSLYQRTRAPRALVRMGTTEIRLGRWLAAEEHLTAALAASADVWVQQRRAAIDAALARARENLASLTIAGGVEGAHVRVDGRDVGQIPLNAPLRVPRGRVTVEVTAEGYQTFQQSMEVASETARADVVLRRAAATTTAAAGPGPGPGRESPGTARPMRTLGIVSMVAGGVGLGLGFIGLAARNGHAAEFNDDPRCSVDVLAGTPQSCQDSYDAGQAMQALSIAGFVTGGVLLAAGAALFVVAPGERRATAFRCGGGPGTLGLSCGLNF